MIPISRTNIAMKLIARGLSPLLAIALLVTSANLGGCAVAEKTHYVEHLSHVVEPADEPDERVIAAFQRERPGGIQPAMASADDRDNE